MLNRPEILPCVAFADIFGILLRIKRIDERTVTPLRLHETGHWIVQVYIVFSPLAEFSVNRIIPNILCQPRNACIIIGILQCL